MSYVQGARVEDAEPFARAARAEAARLALAVRSARSEAELHEREADRLEEVERSATIGLERSLAEIVENRRRAYELDLEAHRATADRRVAAAGQASARRAAMARAEAMARSEPETPHTPAPLPRLRVVDGAGSAVAAHPAASVDDDPADMVVVPPDDLHALVQAAVVAGLREAMEQAVATMRVAPAIAGQLLPADPRPAPRLVGEPAWDEAPLWRRFLYLDVALPSVAALIIIVLFVAWAG